jgi:hypothetical protein
MTGTIEAEAPRDRSAGKILTIWAVIIIALNGVLWISGVKIDGLTNAVELGVARAESRAVGEVSDVQIREAIHDQRETLSFWVTLAMIADFVFEPLVPALRALAVATALGALAALVGRPIGFGFALGEYAALQGIWVLGLALHVALVLILRTDEIDTSLALALPAGRYQAGVWVLLRQADAFALWGWAALAMAGWRRGQVNLATSGLTCALFAFTEAAARVLITMTAGAAMRLMLLPDRP